jgi:Raf kinase inhibitor-like YbhB/YbcL family protein
MKLTSPAFTEGGMIPAKYTCDGDNISPELSFEDVPAGAVSLALVMDDPDIPEAVRMAHGIEVFDHWVLYDLPADTRGLEEGSDAGEKGVHGAGARGYTGPCPPPEHEPKVHRYFFTLYALSSVPRFDAPPTKAELLAAIEPFMLGKAELMGRYTRAS